MGSDASSSESEEDEEDDDGELINANVEKKFLETIAMIRTNDPKLKAVEGELFNDDDFEASSDGEVKAAKKVTYKDLIREDVLNKAKHGDQDSSDDDQMFTNKPLKGGETLFEEEQRLKREFKEKARIEEPAEESDEDFLKKKRNEESGAEEDSIPEDIENLKPDKVLKVAKKKIKKELKMETDMDLLKRFYGDESQLDSTDKFLRNYILLQCWKDKGNSSKSKLQETIDAEDE